MTAKYPSIKRLIGQMAALLAISFALLFAVIFVLSSHSAKLAEKSEQELLPRIHEHQRAALNLERLERMGDLVAYGGDIRLIRKNALSAQVLAFQPSFDFNQAIRKAVRRSYQLIKQLRSTRQRLIKLQSLAQSTTAEIKRLRKQVAELQQQWNSEKQTMFELQNKIISAATRLQAESLQQISLAQKKILITGGCGIAVLILVLAAIGWQLIKHLIRPISEASKAMLSIESGQTCTFGDTRYEETFLISQALQRLSSTIETLHDLATTDEMTRCFNRRHFVNLSVTALDKANRHGTPMSIVMLDIDHFKKVNDRYGHATGDTTLRYFASWLKEDLPEDCYAGRLGGEEFALLLPGFTDAQAISFADKLRNRISLQSQECPDIPSITVSMGVKEKHSLSESIDELFSKADKALYLAKACGRNQVISHNAMEAESETTASYTETSLR